MDSLKIILLFLFLTFDSSIADTIQPFTTDGCSSFPNGTPAQKDLWLSCCIVHDIAYWKGGSYQQRQAADNALKQCVSQTGQPVIAEIMLTGVRVGGSPFFPTSYRWGYGWPYLRGYKPLTESEKKEVMKKIPALPVNAVHAKEK